MKTKEVKSFSEVDISGLKQPIICVYRHPEDYPKKCIARIFDGAKPTNIAIIRDTVDEIRRDISGSFPLMFPFARCKEDTKSIVESWILAEVGDGKTNCSNRGRELYPTSVMQCWQGWGDRRL